MRFRFRCFVMAGALALPVAVSGRPAAAIEPEAARALVQAASADMLKSFAGKDLSHDEAKAAMQRLVDRYCDMGVESRQILGRYWSRAAPTQQKEFEGLLNRFFVSAVGGMIHRVPADLSITVQSAERDGDDRVVVHSLASVPNDPGSAVHWVVMGDRSGRLVITDVSADGVALVTTLKDDFTAVMRAAGGELVSLSASLRTKVEDLAVNSKPAAR